LKLLLDFNLSPKLVALLADLFPEALHISGTGLPGEIPDETIWNYAKQNGFTILTSDFDFVALSDRYGPPPKVIHLESMNYRTRVAAEFIRSRAVLITEFGRGDVGILRLRIR
jgi:predicted nuclease of predicted toxin-antitoxin system